MTRDVGAIVLLLVGGAILRISLGDAYLRYVKEGTDVKQLAEIFA